MIRKIPKLTILILIIGAIALHNISFKKDTREADLQTFLKISKLSFTTANKIKLYDNDLYKLFDTNGKIVGYCLNTAPFSDDIIGYASTVPVLIVFDLKNVIKQIYFLENSETPDFIRGILKTGFMNLWNGISISNATTHKVNAVSGATYTTEAVIDGIKIRLSAYFKQKIESKKTSSKNIKKNLLTGLVLILAFLSFLYPKRFNRYRTLLLIISISILGFTFGTSVSIELIRNWTAYGIPYWTQISLVVLVFLSFVLPLFTNKHFYCIYVCPYGGCQELAGKVKKKKIFLPKKIKSAFKKFRKIFFYTTVFLLLINYSINLSLLEPFSGFIFQNASYITLSIAVLFLIISIFVYKPWCNFFCPTGYLFDIVRKKEKLKVLKTQDYINVMFVIVTIILIWKSRT